MNVRTSAVFTHKLLTYQKSNEWAQRTSAGLVDNGGPGWEVPGRRKTPGPGVCGKPGV